MAIKLDEEAYYNAWWIGKILRVSRNVSHYFCVLFKDSECWFINFSTAIGEIESYTNYQDIGSKLWRRLGDEYSF